MASLYVRTWRTVRARPHLAIVFVVGSWMQATGHAFLAASAGFLAQSLAGGSGPLRAVAILTRAGGGDTLLGIAVIGAAAALCKLIGSVMAASSGARLSGELAADLRLGVLRDVLEGSRDRVRELASLTSHVEDVESGVGLGVFAELRAVLQLLPLALLLALLAPRLAASALIALFAFAVLVLVTRRALRHALAASATESETLLGAADEAVRHADLWTTYGREQRIVSHLESLGRMMIETAARLRGRSALLSAASEVLGALALVLVLSLVSLGILDAGSRAALVPFAIAFFMAYKPLRELVEARLVRARAEHALATIMCVTLPRSPTMRSRQLESGPRRVWSPETLRLDGVVAEHGAHAPVSLTLAHGAVAVLCGPTGIGKTSLLRALLGLEACRAGRVYWGTEDLRGVGPSARPFAWVPQDAPILADTLDANMMLGEGDARSAADLLAMIGAEGLAASLGNAVLTTARAVSGGERQWIAVARALATDLPVLLLDEPTSFLDPASQDKMLAALAALRGKRTILLVTHRPEPLAIADVVVRFA